MTRDAQFDERDVCTLLRLLRQIAADPAEPHARQRALHDALGALAGRDARLTAVIRAEFGMGQVRALEQRAGGNGHDGGLPTLAPRYRRVLERLLRGDSEKQIVRALGLSRHTVHEYVKRIYRSAGVASRGELLARWIARDG